MHDLMSHSSSIMSRLPSTGIRSSHQCVWRNQRRNSSLSSLRRQGRRCSVTVAGVKEIFMPALSSTMTEGKIVSWLKTPGDKVAKGESVAKEEKIEAAKPELVTANASQEQEKPKSPPSPPPQASSPPPPPPPPTPIGRTDGRIVATPYAKKLAQQLGVELSKINGSGPAGRITAQDVEGFKSNGASTSAPVAPSAPPSQNGSAPAKAPAKAAAPAPQAASPSGTSVAELKGTTVPFNAMQSAVSKNMLESLKVPEFRVAYTIVTDKLDTLYKKLKPKGVTMTALLAKAAGIALAKHPIMYAATTKGGDGVTYSEHVNVALAVTMPDGGLITPVIKDADTTDIYQISRIWADLVKRARSKQLAPDEFNSGNFTISNLGMYGAEAFDAILPPGTAGILAVAASKPTVLADEQGRLYVAKQMRVNLTADHRIIYGAAAAEFMQTLKAVIEDPDQLTF